MPRVSKRTKKAETQPQIKYYRTYIYLRLSEKDGGHGRRDSIYIQKQICVDFAKKHPEMLIMKVYTDNGVTGTTFERKAFEELMTDVRAGKVDCIIVKDFSRFGRDALDAVDLIDVIFPTLDVRFISVLDEYDSENPACVQDRVTNILKHFMNDYYAREVSSKLIQAHKISREKGEYWGGRPPYGYERAEDNNKKLVPEKTERKIVQKIFYWYVFEDMSSYDMARELNGGGIPSPTESYEIRRFGKVKRKKRIYWGADTIQRILQNPLYIGAAVSGKTKQMLCENLPFQIIPKEQWEIQENVWEPLIERTVFEQAQQILKERWKDNLEIWAASIAGKGSANGPLLGRIYCGCCGKRMKRSRTGRNGKQERMSYRCSTAEITDETECLKYINEKCAFQAVRGALQYQMKLASDYHTKYGMDFYRKLEKETSLIIKKSKGDYEKYEGKLEQLFEHYATGLIDREEYLEFKETYLSEQEQAHKKLKEKQIYYQNILERLMAKIDWADELIKYQGVTEITREIVERFIEKVVVKSATEITVYFWFGDIFEQEVPDMERGLLDAV